jgi:ABC-type glutathione transport system ATPase component/ABC-type dipeptide/oligopeptide/nickel transport system permease subunit
MSAVDLPIEASGLNRRPGALRRLVRHRAVAAALVLLGAIVLGALLAPVFGGDPDATHLDIRLLAPGTSGHLLGTDQLGRDILVRLAWATRTSLAVGVGAALAAALIGSVVGLLAGFYGRPVDTLLMRGVDIVMAFPYLLLALAIVAALGPGLTHAMIAIVIVNVPFFARTVRGTTLGIVHADFIAAARLAGRSTPQIVAGEILPNVLPAIVVTFSTAVGWMILETAGLSFLGLGAQPPQADLGGMLGEGRDLITVAPHVAAIPGLAILLLSIAINLVGDGIRDALDPRLADDAVGTGAVTAVRRATQPTPRAAAAAVEIADLQLQFVSGKAVKRAVDGVSLVVRPGERVGIVGETGSGKTATALSIMRLVPAPGVVAGGGIFYRGEELGGASLARLQQLRGARVAYVFQNPATSLNPLIPVREQVTETVRRHRRTSVTYARQEAARLFRSLGLPPRLSEYDTYPHQLSGGQRQRIGIAIALANDPDVLIADEPTSALDVATQAQIISLLRAIQHERGAALIFISHDINVVAALCDTVHVMRAGKIIESGHVAEVLSNPSEPYTRSLLAPLPALMSPPRSNPGETPKIEARHLSYQYEEQPFFWRADPVVAVRDVSFVLYGGETLGIVGESGAGKSTLARLLTGLATPSAGTIAIDGIDTGTIDRRGLRRGPQLVFQDPISSFNPRKTILQALAAFLPPRLSRDERDRRIGAALEDVGLPAAMLDRYPHELSGGEIQRAALARALLAEPEIIVLDEPVSALDVSTRAQILELLAKLQRERKLTFVLISHDPAVIAAMATRVLPLVSAAE